VNNVAYPVVERTVLLDVALASIRCGLLSGNALVTAIDEYPPTLTGTRASFVTLKHDDALRGCIGSLEPTDSLVCNIANNAFAAAFRDPRFPALTAQELNGLTIHIAVLGLLQTVECDTEADLLRQLQAGADGWVIEDKGYRGTFLPAVWESLPNPVHFLQHLKNKAGLPENYWSDTIKIWRYSTESFSTTVQEN
jgi:AmmeMemoRadiSam system protein A